MATSDLFGGFLAGTMGMGNPMTPGQPANPFDPRKENEMIPWVYTEAQRAKTAENDPARFREQMQIFKEFRQQEAAEAARIQAERDKRAFQYQMLANIPKTITETSANLAQMALNAPDLRIRAQIPSLIQNAWGAFPDAPISRGRTFS